MVVDHQDAVGEDDKATALEAGADAYMTAPVDYDVLASTLHELLARPRGGQG